MPESDWQYPSLDDLIFLAINNPFSGKPWPFCFSKDHKNRLNGDGAIKPDEGLTSKTVSGSTRIRSGHLEVTS